METKRVNQKKHKSQVILVFIILLGIILFATNPTKSQFKEYIKEDLKEQAYRQDESSGAIMELFATPFSWVAGVFTERKDFIFCSVYELKLPDQEIMYIGILNTFIRIK